MIILTSQKLRRVAGPYILHPVPHGMDDHCPGLRPGDPSCGHPCPHALFEPFPRQTVPLPGIYLNTVTGAKGVYLPAGDTTDQAVPLHRVHHMAMRPRLPYTDKPRHLLARHGARNLRPTDPNAATPHHETDGPIPTTLAGERHFIMEGLTDDIITQDPGGNHGRLERCHGTPHGT